MSRYTKAHLQGIKYDAKHAVGLVQKAIVSNEDLDQAEATSPSGKREKT